MQGHWSTRCSGNSSYTNTLFFQRTNSHINPMQFVNQTRVTSLSNQSPPNHFDFGKTKLVSILTYNMTSLHLVVDIGFLLIWGWRASGNKEAIGESIGLRRLIWDLHVWLQVCQLVPGRRWDQRSEIMVMLGLSSMHLHSCFQNDWSFVIYHIIQHRWGWFSAQVSQYWC